MEKRDRRREEERLSFLIITAKGNNGRILVLGKALPVGGGRRKKSLFSIA